MQVYKNIILMGGVGYDCNTYLIDGEVLVDTGTGIFFSQMKEEIEAMGYDLNHIRTIINTHCHFDHSGGNKKFRDWLKAKIAIHEDDKEAVETGSGTLAHLFGQTSKTVTMDEVLENGDKIRTENFIFEVLSTPGHTPGSICLYEKNKKILISGDTLFESSTGRTDYPGGSKIDMKKSLEKLSKLNAIYLLPGHGMPKIGGVSFLTKQMLFGRNRAEFI
ncbi:MAG: MBL fold metallo-hydrolase [Candidatus Aenigmarchaeota archaeon]|nr:MBL fold metallo-hydrolase [Candidatus Aenigmarchaeota archaeon]